jgi:hypothetical protein
MSTPASPKPSPFAGIPISDFLRDGFALALLLISLAMPWNFASVATGRIEVILLTLLSVFSLSITYLARAAVFPPTFTVTMVWMLRLLVNVPYVVLVLVYLIIDAASGANYVTSGIGYAAAYGIAGAILAAQPRQAEVKALAYGAPIGELWYRIVAGFGAVSVLSLLASLILILVRPGIAQASGISIFVVVATVLFNLTAVTLLYAGMLRRSESGRLVALAIGTIALSAALIDLFSRFQISVGAIESLHAVGFGMLLFGAIAGLAAAPPVRLAMLPVEPHAAWVRAVSVLFVVTAAVALYTALLAIVALAAGGLGSGYTGFGIGTIVTTVAIALVAIVARSMLANNPSWTLVLGAGGALLLLGIVHIIITGSGSRVGILDLALAFGLPAAIIGFLTVPLPMRQHFAALAARLDTGSKQEHPTFVEQLERPEAHVAKRKTAPAAATVRPAAVAPKAGAAVDVAADVATALDPATPGATLYQLAQHKAELRRYIAANPSTYPELLAWLGTLGDPAIDAALAAREG